MDEQVGQQLGNYRLVRLLGQGGFADVYLGEHIHLHTQAAIKILQMRLAEEHAESFINEARTIAHLIHPNIVRVLDFGVQNAVPFLVMDYAPGGTLRQRMPNGKPLPASGLFPFIGQVASALQYAHNRKLIHRDVKPENMLIGVNGEVLLSDFGLALVTQSTRSRSVAGGGGDISGTATYMAPEQVQGQPRPASDQYALAVMVYEWLTGTRPFQGTFLEVATQQVLAPTPTLRSRLPAISPALEEVVMHAMAKDYQQRYPSVQEFASALAQVCLREGLISPQVAQAVQSAMPAPSSPGQSPLGSVSQLTYLPSATNQGSPPSPAGPSQLSFMQSSGSQGTQNNYAAETQADPQASQLTFVKSPPQQTQWPPNAAPSSQAGWPQMTGNANLTQAAPMNSQMQQYTQMAPQQIPSQMGQSSFGQPQSGAGMFGNQPFTPPPANDNIAREQRRTNRLIVLVSVVLVLVLVVGGTGIWLSTHGEFGSKNAATPPTTTAQNGATSTTVAPTATSAAATPTTATGGATPTSAAATPTPSGAQVSNPYAASMSMLALNDPLSGNQHGWDEGDTCSFSGGAYHVTVPTGQSAICYAKSTNFTNFTYEVQMTLIKGGTGSAGIEFRGNNSSGASYRVELFSSGKFNFLACTDAKTCTPIATDTLAQIAPGQTKKLAVVASGNTFSGYLDGQQIFSQRQDGTSGSGMIGVYAQGGTDGDADVAFSNARVWQ